MKAIWRFLTSLRTALSLMAMLALLLLLNIALPQRALLGEEGFREMTRTSNLAHFALDTLGFGAIPTHPLFLATLTLFFLSLGCSLIERLQPILKRSKVKPPSEKAAMAWLSKPQAISAEISSRWDSKRATRALRGRGYRLSSLADHCYWGVRNASAPIGFALFHASFFVLCAGGMLLYGTRFVGTANLVEGNPFDGSYAGVIRYAPWTGPPTIRFSIENVEWKFVDGDPVHLGADVRFLHVGGNDIRPTRVNHPAVMGSTTILIERTGLAPLFWLQDADGYTLDRVVAAARTFAFEPTVIPIHEGRLEVVILPSSTEELPDRNAVAGTPLRLLVREAGGGDTLFEGAVYRGEAVDVGPDRLVFEDVKMWAGLLIVSERGGNLLIAGFTLGVVGLVWRLLWYRREVFVTWDDDRLTINGRSEKYPLRFREELDELLPALVSEGEGGRNSDETLQPDKNDDAPASTE